MQAVIKYINLFFFFILALGIFILALFPPAIRPSPAENFETKVKDMSNRQVSITVPAQRVVIFPPVAWDYITVDEGVDNILATSNFIRNEIRQSLIERIYPASPGIPAAFTRGMNTAVPGDPEALLLAKPDAVLSWAHFSDPLKQVGLPVVEVRKFDSEQGMFTLYRVIAAMTGRNGRGERLIQHYLEKRGENERQVADLKGKKPTALFLWLTGPNSIYVANQDTSYSRALQVAGAENQASDYQSASIDFEQLLLLNPDVIFLNSALGTMNGPEYFYNQPPWQVLSAVKNKRVYKQPLGSARMTGLADEPLLQLWMAELLYPDLMPRLFRNEFKSVYQEIYHYDLSDDEIDRNIFLNENRRSAGYERFVR